MDMLDDDEELFAELLELFTENTDETIKSLAEAAKSGDLETVAATAHSIKGSAANLSVERVRALASDLEQLAKNSEAADYQAFAVAIREEFQNFVEQVAESQ